MAFPHQLPHGWMHHEVFTLSEDVQGQRFTGRWDAEGPVMEPEPLPAGTRVKVVSVSRFWDCGITADLGAKTGYVARVDPGILLSDGSETAEQARAKDEAHECWVLQQALFEQRLEPRPEP